jgi:hypothetical protein
MLFPSVAGDSSIPLGCHKPLPRVLKLQLDNCAGDNKNRFVMAYLSLLTAREVFEEVHLGFLMVGHTHEDVDAMFGHFSELLMRVPVYTLPDLMSLLMRARTPNPVPHFVQEVPNFKSFLDPFLLKGQDALVGHLKPRLFRLYVRDDGMPCLQYKMKSMDMVWMPPEGIEMWSWTNDKRPNLPIGVPKRLPMTDIKMLDMVQDGLQKHITFFRQIHRRIEPRGKIAFQKCIDYWVDILGLLEKEKVQYRIEDGVELMHGFWPVSKWRDNVPIQFREMACDLDPEVNYVGPQRDRPRASFHPRVDIKKGDFILQRPDTDDLSTYPVHMGLVVSDGVEEGSLNAENKLEHVCEVKWYRPHMTKKRGQVGEYSPKQRWSNCWVKKWEYDPDYAHSEKISVNSVLWSFSPRRTKKLGLVAIPNSHALRAQDNLRRCLEVEAANASVM